MSEAEIDLNALPDDELVTQMHDDLYDGLAPEIAEGTNILLGRGWAPDKVLNDALVGGMRIVGIDFRDGILFVPEVLLAANAMKAGMAILRPLLAETGVERIGKVVIGTVKGDIHDIGKNLVAMMLEGAGFEVIDLGINTPVEQYLEALEEHQPEILGMSALLTTTMPYMKVVIDTLNEKGLRNDYIVLVGGAPLNEEFGDGDRCRCVLPRRRRRSRDRAGARARAPRRGEGLAARGPDDRAARDGGRVRRDRASRRAHPRVRRDRPRGARGDQAQRVDARGRALPAGQAPLDPGEDRRRRRRQADRAEGPVRERLRRLRRLWHGRRLDIVLNQHNVERLPGAHCYGFLAGNDAWDAMQEEELGTYYLTDFLARHFESLIVRPFKLDTHPELLPMMFGNYKRLIYLAQTDNDDLRQRARAAAAFLGLEYEERRTGYGELQPSLVQFVDMRDACLS